VLLLVICAGCSKAESDLTTAIDTAPSTSSATAPNPQQPPADPPGIHNLIQVSARIYSGSEPHGEEGFASLQQLGAKTVVSVDGAKPNLELARKYGLHYVHIPIGYDGIPTEAGQSLARVMRDARAPIYVHCHHGKHRGPAAAAVACVAAAELDGRNPHEILTRAGTSKDYVGLWRDVAAYEPPPQDAALPELIEVAEVGSFAAAMAQIDRSVDNLKLCRDANWGVPPDHPDLVPSQEALLLQEGFHEAARNLADEYDEQFETWLHEADALAADLRAALEAGDHAAATERAALVEQACKQCHKQYRDQ
jgi:protein tyrosine phosphatase (PTP) superfamily phosphohydrolase (DUF442 family)